MINRSALGCVFALVISCAAVIVQLPAAAAAEASGDIAWAQVVFRISGDDDDEPCGLDAVLARHDLVLDETLLPSRRLHRAHGVDPDLEAGPKGAADLAKHLGKDDCIAYAEADLAIQLADTKQFHSWAPGAPTHVDGQDWRSQPAVEDLGLGEAHASSDGADVLVAVLDTGIDASHQALGGRTVAGWDYVDDDASSTDEPCGCDSDADGSPDGAVGHGTFVAGTISLVAPGAAILPMRVLDGDGQGSLFTVAEATVDVRKGRVDIVASLDKASK